MARYLLDIGSHSIKLYKKNFSVQATQIEKISYNYKINYSDLQKPIHLCEEDEELLLKNLIYLRDKFGLTKFNTSIYATGLYRDIKDLETVIADIYEETGLYFNVISQELEAHYMAPIIRNFEDNLGNTILINIGGSSTEILLHKRDHAKIERHLLSIGTNTILREKFPTINQANSVEMLDEIVEYLSTHIPATTIEFDTAIYTGGELSFMTLLGYPLIFNHIFYDSNHPKVISAEEYYLYNTSLFSKWTIDDLHKLMPENPKWMDGARACSAIAESIFKTYKVKTIIPSDLNLIDGICSLEGEKIYLSNGNGDCFENDSLSSLIDQQHDQIINIKYILDSTQINLFDYLRTPLSFKNIPENSRVTLCGSYNKYLKEITQYSKYLSDNNIKVLSPQCTATAGSIDDFILFQNDRPNNNCKWSIERNHLQAIEKSDYVVICNVNGYIGISTAIEIGYALKCQKELVFIDTTQLKICFPNFELLEASDYCVVANNNNVSITSGIEIGYAMKCCKKIVFVEDDAIARDIDGPFEVGLLQ